MRFLFKNIQKVKNQRFKVIKDVLNNIKAKKTLLILSQYK